MCRLVCCVSWRLWVFSYPLPLPALALPTVLWLVVVRGLFRVRGVVYLCG